MIRAVSQDYQFVSTIRNKALEGTERYAGRENCEIARKISRVNGKQDQ